MEEGKRKRRKKKGKRKTHFSRFFEWNFLPKNLLINSYFKNTERERKKKGKREKIIKTQRENEKKNKTIKIRKKRTFHE